MSQLDLSVLLAGLSLAAPPAPAPRTKTKPSAFVGITPCRVMDTRKEYGFTGPFGPPALAARETRTLPIPAYPDCAIPAGVEAYALNITVVPPASMGFLTVWPAGQPIPNASLLNALGGQITANGTLVAAGTMGAVNLFVSDPSDVIVDVYGYFLPVEMPDAKARVYGTVLPLMAGVYPLPTGATQIVVYRNGMRQTLDVDYTIYRVEYTLYYVVDPGQWWEPNPADIVMVDYDPGRTQ